MAFLYSTLSGPENVPAQDASELLGIARELPRWDALIIVAENEQLSAAARYVARGSRLRRPMLRGRGVVGVLPCHGHFVLVAGHRNRNGRTGA